jgi:hypothetical protein
VVAAKYQASTQTAVAAVRPTPLVAMLLLTMVPPRRTIVDTAGTVGTAGTLDKGDREDMAD